MAERWGYEKRDSRQLKVGNSWGSKELTVLNRVAVGLGAEAMESIGIGPFLQTFCRYAAPERACAVS